MKVTIILMSSKIARNDSCQPCQRLLEYMMRNPNEEIAKSLPHGVQNDESTCTANDGPLGS